MSMHPPFVKGRTNNHLTWVMVDATDFATPESALSAATKIKIYGKTAGATGVNFVSSGTGSLTNDIQHVGASALGIYTIALAKADLSDASAAWYDQYIISLSATGAAYQALVVDGGIWISDLSAILSDVRSDVSDMHSDLIVMSGILSDAYSMLVANSDAVSNVYSAVLITQSLVSDVDSALTSRFSDILSLVTTTGVQLNASSLSDLRSAISGGPAATVTASDISDIASAVWAFTTRKLTSNISLNASDLSDIRSAIAAGPAATVTASDISDIASAVWANTIGARVDSRLRLVQSDVSDLTSRVSSTPSNKSQLASATYALFASFISDVTSAFAANSDAISDLKSVVTVTGVQLNASSLSDLRSAISAGAGATVTASDISDIASAVWAFTTRKLTSNISLNASDLSDIRSAIAAGPAATVTASDISDIASAVWANTIGARVDSRLLVVKSDVSDLTSRITGATATKSQVASATYALFASFISDVTSAFAANSDAISDLKSVVTTTGVQLNASSLSDLRSAITAGGAAAITASDISDIASAVWAYTLANKIVTLNSSDLSDLRSAISAGAAGTLTVSDISDIASRVQAVLASDLSDILSAAQQTNSRVLVTQSLASDAHSAAVVARSLASDAHSMAVANSAALSDIYSLLSDVSSDLGVMSGIQSDIASAVLNIGIKKNTALANFEFLMVDSADHITPKTGLTVTATRSLDGGALAACANAVSELSNGIYKISLASTDLNGAVVTLRFTATGADDRVITLLTQP